MPSTALTPHAVLHRVRPGLGAATDVALGAVVLGLSIWPGYLRTGDTTATGALITVGMAVAAGLARRWSGWALAVVWALALAALFHSSVVLAVEVALPFVGYRIARHGSRMVVWAAGVSIPVGAAVAVGFAVERPLSFQQVAVVAGLLRVSGLGVVSGFLVVTGVLGAPFALGLASRINERYRSTRAERELAEAHAAAQHDLAELRATQTALAREVHDVVGHSLAVIIAQADSVQQAAKEADESVRAALVQIAAVGRSSLAEVRDVLARTRDVPAASPQLDLTGLIEGVRAAGNDVTDVVTGESVELDAARATTAYRVLQEMLTNSLKHGAPGGTIEVERVWTPDGLTLRVTNGVRDHPDTVVEGMGLTGLRTRVEALGGTFRVATIGAGGSTARFVATAFLPVGA